MQQTTGGTLNLNIRVDTHRRDTQINVLAPSVAEAHRALEAAGDRRLEETAGTAPGRPKRPIAAATRKRMAAAQQRRHAAEPKPKAMTAGG